MDSGKYSEITGITIADDDLSKYAAACGRSKRKLESLLGYALDERDVDENFYDETGKTQDDCPVPDADLTLDSPDAVVYAYRLFTYNKSDAYFHIDPCTEVHAVKLVKDGVTYRTFESDEYRVHYKNGIAKYLEIYAPYTCGYYCNLVQLAVDAAWAWQSNDDIPGDLLDVWADMVTYIVDDKRDIKSESIGSHSYTRDVTASVPPETIDSNIEIIKKYAGGNGLVFKNPTV